MVVASVILPVASVDIHVEWLQDVGHVWRFQQNKDVVRLMSHAISKLDVAAVRLNAVQHRFRYSCVSFLLQVTCRAYSRRMPALHVPVGLTLTMTPGGHTGLLFSFAKSRCGALCCNCERNGKPSTDPSFRSSTSREPRAVIVDFGSVSNYRGT